MCIRDRKTLTRLKKLLTTPDASSIVQGVELVTALKQPELFRVLLADVEYTEEGYPTNKGMVEGRLVANKLFTGPIFRQPWLDLSMSLLLAASNLPLRNKVKRLTLGGDVHGKAPLTEFPYQGLARLPKLERLELIFTDDTQIDLSSLALLKSLKSLVLTGNENDVALTGHAGVTTLKVVKLSVEKLGNWPMLESLEIDNHSASHVVLDGSNFPRLKKLDLCGRAELDGLPVLEEVYLLGPLFKVPASIGDAKIKSCPQLRSIRGDRGTISYLEKVPLLESVRLTITAGITLESIASIDSIKTLYIATVSEIRNASLPKNAVSQNGSMTLFGNIEDLGNLGTLKGLEKLSIENQDQPLLLDSLSKASALRALDVRGCTGITSLEPIKDLKELRIVAIKNSGVIDVPESIRHLVSHALDPDIHDIISKPRRDIHKKTKIPVAEEHREEWEAIKNGLAVEDLSCIHDAVDRAIAIGPDAINFLLSKVKVNYDGSIKMLAPFRLKKPGLGVSAVSRLLNAAPNFSKDNAHLQKVSMLYVQATKGNPVVELVDVSGFSNLKHLAIEHPYCWGTKNVELLNLERTELITLFVLFGSDTIDINGGLPVTLKRAFFSPAPPLEQLAGSVLTELYLNGFHTPNLNPLSQCKELKRLFVYNAYELDGLLDVSLVEISVEWSADLRPLIGHPTLKTIRVFRCYHAQKPIPEELAKLVKIIPENFPSKEDIRIEFQSD